MSGALGTGLTSRIVRAISVNQPDGCWLWVRGLDRFGYGRISTGGKTKLAHRVVYELFVGSIPSGKTLDHLCRNRKCVNPAHLEPVSNFTNVMRGESFSAVNARKTNCDSGHPLSGNNLHVSGSKRRCKACNLAAKARHRARQKQKTTEKV